ncbi:hypothetical protein [Nocardia wallacei]|uniref:hypothetical protein n=1 Tax=Nocardia wallacei TaxID=480035 RepID=UPI002454DD41|nr:hypothetical protein [Nocardia wallacei]
MSRGEWRDWVWCNTCRKRRYRSRKAAKQAVHIVPGTRMSAYECVAAPGFHIGHLPRSVRRGETSRDAYYADVATAA